MHGGVRQSIHTQATPRLLRAISHTVISSTEMGIPIGEMSFESLNRMAPFWGRRFADAILVSKESCFIDGLSFWQGLKPMNTYNTLCPVWIT